MRTITPEPITAEAFLPFGFFAAMTDPAAVRIGEKPIEFFRDMLQIDLGGATSASFSTCRIEPREPVIDVTEFHSFCGEGILPLDNDVLIHVGPATPGDEPPLEDFWVFRLPKGTMAMLRPGVWHHAAFSANDCPANVLIVLPERTYANDCTVIELDGEDHIHITL